MQIITKKTISALCAMSMAFSITAFAEETPAWDYDTPSPECTQDSVIANDPYYDFYDKHGYDSIADVYYNGEYIEFDKVYPLVREGTTFIPIKAFSDILGAEISYDNATETVSINYEDTIISFKVGSNQIIVDSEIITLPANTFELDGYTMVPVKLISEAFDLEVYLNELWQEVSILDTNSLKEGIDTDYTIINSLLAMQSTYDMTSNFLVVGDMTIKLSEDNNDLFIATANIEALVDKEQSALNYDLDMSIDLGNLETELMVILEDYGDDDAIELYKDLFKSLKSFNLEYILDLENLEIYIKSDMFDLLGKYVLESDIINNDTWIKISYKDLLTDEQLELLEDQLTDAKSGEISIDVEYIVDLLIEQSKMSTMSYNDFYSMTETVLDVISDDKFEKKDNQYILEYSTTNDDNATSTSKLVLDSNSDDEIISYSYEFSFDDDYSKLTLNLSQKDAESIIFEFNMSDDDVSFDITFDLNMIETDKNPLQKPDSDNILDMNDFIY